MHDGDDSARFESNASTGAKAPARFPQGLNPRTARVGWPLQPATNLHLAGFAQCSQVFECMAGMNLHVSRAKGQREQSSSDTSTGLEAKYCQGRFNLCNA